MDIDMNMEKENIAWVIVRALGIYFLAQVFLNLYSLTGLYVSFSTIQEILRMPSPEDRAYAQIIRLKTEVSFTVFYFIFSGFLSYYCLRKGKFIHKLLMYVENKTKT